MSVAARELRAEAVGSVAQPEFRPHRFIAPDARSRAATRRTQTSGTVATHQADIRELELEDDSFDIITAAAVLHHLRDEDEWREVFAKFHRILKPGGSVWISDLVTHSIPALHTMMWTRYGDYLREMKGDEYRDEVFAYIEKEDTPRPLLWQLEMLRSVGFTQLEILHKNSMFAAFGAVKD
jgi:tRNA (cmo5U34)-methyltransferase